MTKCQKFAATLTGALVLVLGQAAIAFAQSPTPSSIATDTATSIKDQFLPVMVAVIPIVVVLLVAKRGYRWAKGQAK